MLTVDTTPLIQAAYDAAGNRDAWEEFLRRYIAAFGARGAVLVHASRDRGLASITIWVGIEDYWIRAHNEHYRNINPYALQAARNPPDTVYHACQIVPKETLLRTEFGADFVAPQRLHLASTMMNLHQTPAMVTGFAVHYDADYGDGRVDEALPHHQALIGHLKSALLLHERLVDLEARNADLTFALEHTEHAVVICDQVGRVSALAGSAECLLNERDGLSYEKGRLQAARTRNGGSLSRLIRDVAELSEGHDSREPSVVRVARPSGKSDYQLLVVPVPRRQDGLRLRGGRVLIFIHDPDKVSGANADLVAKLYGLTPRETQVLTLLTRGTQTNEIADRLQLGSETIRTHLKAIYDKTGARRQTELIARVLSELGRLRGRRS